MATCIPNASSFPAFCALANTTLVCAPGFNMNQPCNSPLFCNTTCTEPLYRSCTVSGSGTFEFHPDSFLNQSSECATTIPTVSIAPNTSATLVLKNVIVDSHSSHVNVTLYGGNYSGNASSLWAHDGSNVSGAVVTGPYFGGKNVTTVPQSCGYMPCTPLNANNTSTCATNVTNPGRCIGDYSGCIEVNTSTHFCVSEDCDWVQNASTYASNLFHFPATGCRAKTICDHYSGPAIFPNENTCLCFPGYILSGVTCTINTTGNVPCGVSKYRNLETYECLSVTTCDDTGTLIEATETSDAICITPPTVCVGVVGEAGICVTPTQRCTTLQFIVGSSENGSAVCSNLSPPCGKHAIETSPPTVTSDRVCKKLGSDNMVVATIVMMLPAITYLVVYTFFRVKRQ